MNEQHMNGQSYTLKLLISIVLLLVNILIPSAIAAPAPQFTEQSIMIDGKFDESAWQNAFNINDFTVVKPDTGAKPIHQTETKILYSPDGVYTNSNK